MRKTFKIIVGILIFGFCLYHISLWTQNRNLDKYGTEFNSERKRIGLSKLSKDWNSEKQTWDNWNELAVEFSADNQMSKLVEIFSLSDIPTGVIFVNDSITKNEFHQAKVIWLNSNLLFWRNKITSEMDVYNRTLDSVTEENLIVRYYFKDDNENRDYFEVNFYQIDENEFNFCGTPAVMEREEQRISGKPYFGNITKKQADSILSKWKEK